MQKKIIALAVAAAFSTPVFADTTLYGIFDAAITSTTKTGYKNRIQLTSGGLSTSRLGVKVTEALDDGMKVTGLLEYKLDLADNTSTLAAPRQKMVALEGNFGTVAAGFLQTTGYDFSAKFNPFSGSAVDPYSAANPTSYITSSSRAQHAVAYKSPAMNGVKFAFTRAFNFNNDAKDKPEPLTPDGATSGNETTVNVLSVTFDQGPLSVGGAYAGDADDDTGFAKKTEMSLAASYDFGMAKVNATYLSAKETGSKTDRMIGFSAVAPVGSGQAVFGYDKNNRALTWVSADGKQKGKQSAFTVAYLQNLSKSVTAYGAVERISNETNTATTNTTVLAVGLRKKF